MADETTNTAVTDAPAQEAAIEQVETPVTPLNDLFTTAQPVKVETAPPAPEKVETTPVEAKDEESTEEAKPDTEKAVEPPLEEIKASYEKRIKDTSDYSTRVNQENQQLKATLNQQQQYLTMINKKLDGTWTEADEAAAQAPKGPTPEEALQYGHIEGKIAASREAAFSIYGQEEVEKTLFAPNAPFVSIMDDPIVRQKVLSSNAPVIEAMKIVKVKQFYDRYGYEPEAIERNIREDERAKLTDKITKDVMKKLSGKSAIPEGIRDIKGVDVQQPTAGMTPLKEIFG